MQRGAGEFELWRAYGLIEPWWARRMEYAIATAAASLAAAQGTRADPADFMPPVVGDDEPDPQAKADEIDAVNRMFR